MKIFKEDLVLTEDTTFDESIEVEGNITGRFDLKVAGNIVAGDIVANDIVARNIDAWDIDAWNIDAGDIVANDIVAGNIVARNIVAYAFIIAYSAFKCNSWKCRRENGFARCLDGVIEIKQDKVCSKCGHKLK